MRGRKLSASYCLRAVGSPPTDTLVRDQEGYIGCRLLSHSCTFKSPSFFSFFVASVILPMDPHERHFKSCIADMGSWSLIITSAVVYLIYKLSTTFDDVYLGPMSKFPGPKLWAATALPSTIKLWRGEEALAKHALHDKYGPVVRVTPTELSYCNGRA